MSMLSPTQRTGPDECDCNRRTEHRTAPNPEAVREVARRLREAGQRDRIEFCMTRKRVLRWTMPPWRTVACHGGSYVLARSARGTAQIRTIGGEFTLPGVAGAGAAKAVRSHKG